MRKKPLGSQQRVPTCLPNLLTIHHHLQATCHITKIDQLSHSHMKKDKKKNKFILFICMHNNRRFDGLNLHAYDSRIAYMLNQHSFEENPLSNQLENGVFQYLMPVSFLVPSFLQQVKVPFLIFHSLQLVQNFTSVHALHYITTTKERHIVCPTYSVDTS